MSDKPSPEDLAKHWVHSHEEDSPGMSVFRPDTYAFPPSRGRKELDLSPDGSFAGQLPGPDDRPVMDSGTWSVSGDKLHLEASKSGTPQDWKIESLDPTKLVVRR
jgi:hypothetical protein